MRKPVCKRLSITILRIATLLKKIKNPLFSYLFIFNISDFHLIVFPVTQCQKKRTNRSLSQKSLLMDPFRFSVGYFSGTVARSLQRNGRTSGLCTTMSRCPRTYLTSITRTRGTPATACGLPNTPSCLSYQRTSSSNSTGSPTCILSASSS